jgi:D-3-phosphoglycerate dehydrogenase / 2-oxoglutarate reductase
LLLALLRRIVQASASAQDGEWNRDLFRGSELDGKRLGVVGLGRIGRKVAGYGLAFDMRVAAYDPYVTDWIDGVVRAGTLSDLLSRSDVLSLHVPLSSETVGMIGANELALLPLGTMLVNTSRGEVVEEIPLVRALESSHLGGAALDVIAHERDPKLRQQSRLLAYARTHNNLLLTPHIGGATHESMARTEIFMARKLAALLGDSRVTEPSII